jgi:hypothetical protein
MIQWFKSAANKEIKELEKKLSSMPLKDKINILSLIDVDLDSYFANLIYQKMISDDKIKAKIEELLNMSTKQSNSIDLSQENTSIEQNKEEVPSFDNNVVPSVDEHIKNDKKDDEKKVKHIKLRKDEFTTKASLEGSAIDTPLSHERDIYSIWQDYGAHEGYTAYDPSYPEDYIEDDIAYNSYDTSDKNVKGVRYKKIIWFKKKDVKDEEKE